jgi:hypothetical protein
MKINALPGTFPIKKRHSLWTNQPGYTNQLRTRYQFKIAASSTLIDKSLLQETFLELPYRFYVRAPPTGCELRAKGFDITFGSDL